MPILDPYRNMFSEVARLAGEKCATRIFGTRQRQPHESVRLTQEELAAIIATAVDSTLEMIRTAQEEQAALLILPAAGERPS